MPPWPEPGAKAAMDSHPGHRGQCLGLLLQVAHRDCDSVTGARGAINGFIEGLQGGSEQETPHAQLDMRGISPALCRREGVVSIYFFPNQIGKERLRNSLIPVFVLWLILTISL